MAYETGTSSGANDLLDKLRLFAAAQGWAVNRWVTAGSGRELCLSKGSAYFNLRSYQNETVTYFASNYTSRTGIGLNGSNGYDAGLAWSRQPGYPVYPPGAASSNQVFSYLPMVVNPGPFPAYHLFAPDSKTIYLELEITTGTFLRLGFGSLDLFNPAAPGGGRFFYSTASNPSVDSTVSSSAWLGNDVDNNVFGLEEVPFRMADYAVGGANTGSYLRASFDSFNGWCGSSYDQASPHTRQACQGGGVHDSVLRDASPNPINGIGVILPNVVSINRANEFLQPAGVVPGMRYMDMTNYLPGDEFTFGSDTWKVFPWYNKGGRSGQRGIAYKKVT